MRLHAQTALIENELALIYVDLGNLAEAERHLAAARTDMAAAGDDFRMAHVADTDARIALERGDIEEGVLVNAVPPEENHRTWIFLRRLFQLPDKIRVSRSLDQAN